MVDTDGDVVGYIDSLGRAWARDACGEPCTLGPGAELDYAHPSNVGHILDHVREKSGAENVGLVSYTNDDGVTEWAGVIDYWNVTGTLPDILRAMVERAEVSDG